LYIREKINEKQNERIRLKRGELNGMVNGKCRVNRKPKYVIDEPEG